VLLFTRFTEISLPDTEPVFFEFPAGLLAQALVKVDLLLHDDNAIIMLIINMRCFTIDNCFLCINYNITDYKFKRNL